MELLQMYFILDCAKMELLQMYFRYTSNALLMILQHILGLLLRNVHCKKKKLQIKFIQNIFISKSQAICQ